ncbi:uncharacterized protein [Physcomitrium patens]|uniref:uncharacterized protein isoform X7 n=1 Tax=Physcomitrium patens TaxID=3218 RepID=UPI000D17C3BC|nr:chromodomain-helicase-DNA-binding protein 8-like isoform X7 [Physcomitrium patens]|eukprot:XP_024396986.1 chromodomain-helicase-DNA-binding protein 8-like isoform X7 [Physcomitrella patens]
MDVANIQQQITFRVFDLPNFCFKRFMIPMQLRKRKPVNYSDDHALFSKLLSETEDPDSSDTNNFLMGNVAAHGKSKTDIEASSEGDVETALARSWGSFHLRSVLGGRRGQNSNQDGGDTFVKTSKLAGMTTSERVDVLVRGAGLSDVALLSEENSNSMSGFNGFIRMALPSFQEEKRKRKLEELEKVRNWERPSSCLGLKEGHFCDPAHHMRNDNGIRPAAPRSAPTVGQHDVSCNEESRHLPLHEIQLNGKESPTSASLDKFQEELSTVNVANGSYQDEHTAEEMNCRELSEKEKLSLNSGDKVEACLPDLDDPSTSGVEDHATLDVSSSRPKRLRRIRQVSSMKQKLGSGRMAMVDDLAYHQFVECESSVKTARVKIEGIAPSSSYDGEYKLEGSDNFGHNDDLSLELPFNKHENRPYLVRRIGRVEKILSVKSRDAGADAVFRVKETLRSYRETVSVQGSVLQKHCPQLLRSFHKRMDHLGRKSGHTLDDTNSPDFDPVYTKIDRIIASEQRGSKKYYLVKWCGLPYTEATWVREENLSQDVAAICRFHKISLRTSAVRRAEILSQGVFKDGRRLRDYQEAGVAWLDHNFKNRTNCILADEMGLGKTIQILLTSFEILMKDQNKLARETWQYIIVDEAHRLKSRESKTAQALRQLRVRHGGLLLLTGTPVQNNTKELFSLLYLLDRNEFDSEEDFLLKYGDIKAAEQIKDLQDNILRPRLLRRMKEDVEKSIPMKEEVTIVWVELTKEQRAFYRAIYENNISTLLKGSIATNMPSLRNVAMELRKLCNHPFLCDGLEESIVFKHRSLNDGNASNLAETLLSQSSGKMVLVDKLLPKLKEAGRRVLIFSQFTMMLDLLEDYLLSKGYSYERIDGKIRGSDRQAAIDRYSAKDSSIFVFLLSTRAGGLGITLTAADTCIIYDSDWNPQNDLQAMARCHRIGQTKDVKIYRLITRNTYEQRLFECSSRKYGLDEAILGNRMGVDVTQDHNKNIESLLKHGAYDILKDDGEAASEFSSQNIEQILEQRTQQRQIGGRTNNTFSVATFISNPELASEDIPEAECDATASWHELLPEACEKAVLEAMDSKSPILPLSGGLRKRTRSGMNYKDMGVFVENENSDGNDALRKMRKCTRARVGQEPQGLDPSVKQWSDRELKRLEDQLFALGRGRTDQIMGEARLSHRGSEEVEEVSEALIHLCQYMQVCNGFGVFQPDSPTTGEVTGKASDRRYPIIGPSLSAIQEQGITKSKLITKVETRSKRNCGTRVLSNATKLMINGEIQPSRGKSQLDAGGESLEDTHHEPPVVPAVALLAMQSLEFQQRLQKEAQRYLQSLEDSQLLAEALQSQLGAFPPHVAFRSKKLPDWWGKKEDADLLKAAHLYGHKFFKRMKSDTSLSFVSRVNTLVNTKNSNAKSRPKVQDSIGKKSEDLPSESVLCSRLKKLTEALRDAARKKVPEMVHISESSHRKAGDRQGSDAAPLNENPEKAIGVLSCPPSSNQLCMTKILTASLAMDFEKKGKGEGSHSKGASGTHAGLPDCNMAGSKGRFLRSPYFSGTVRSSKVFRLKKKKSSRSRRTVQFKSPKQEDVIFKVLKDEKRKEIQDSLRRKQQASDKHYETGSSSRKYRNVSCKSRSYH